MSGVKPNIATGAKSASGSYDGAFMPIGATTNTGVATPSV